MINMQRERSMRIETWDRWAGMQQVRYVENGLELEVNGRLLFFGERGKKPRLILGVPAGGRVEIGVAE